MKQHQEAVAVGTEMILAGMRHDEARPFSVVGGAESMQYPFCLFNYRGRKVGEATQKYGPIEARALPPGTHLQDATPMRLGQEFGGDASQVKHWIGRVERARDSVVGPIA